jgi:hypothetical protein
MNIGSLSASFALNKQGIHKAREEFGTLIAECKKPENAGNDWQGVVDALKAGGKLTNDLVRCVTGVVGVICGGMAADDLGTTAMFLLLESQVTACLSIVQDAETLIEIAQRQRM